MGRLPVEALDRALHSIKSHLPYEELEESDLFKIMNTLPRWQVETISKACTQAKKKYQKKSKPKYYGLPRSLNDEQLYLFFNSIKNPMHKTAFLLQFFLGLRESELRSIKILWNQELIAINNYKCDRKDYLPLFSPVKEILQQNKIPETYTAPYLSKLFRIYRSKLPKLCFVYSKSADGRDLYQFSNHSLRHTAITTVHKHVKDRVKTTMFSRHEESSLGVVRTYIHYGMEELKEDLEAAFKKYKDLI